MLFYLIVTVLFSFGLHRFSAEIAVLLAAVALVLGPLLPARLLSSSPSALRDLTAVTALVLLVGVAAVCSRRRGFRVADGLLLAALVVALLAVKQRDGVGEDFIVLAMMFAGTALWASCRWIELPFQALGRRFASLPAATRPTVPAEWPRHARRCRPIGADHGGWPGEAGPVVRARSA